MPSSLGLVPELFESLLFISRDIVTMSEFEGRRIFEIVGWVDQNHGDPMLMGQGDHAVQIEFEMGNRSLRQTSSRW